MNDCQCFSVAFELNDCLFRNVKRMQLTSKEMEKENAMMETKIGALKEKMKKEKEEREWVGGLFLNNVWYSFIIIFFWIISGTNLCAELDVMRARSI